VSQVQARRAPVRPRVQVRAGGIARLLEEEIAELLLAGEQVVVRLHGPWGSGKTTALEHLAAVFAGDPRVTVSDGPGPGANGSSDGGYAVVRVTAMLATTPVAAPPPPGVRAWTLAPWTDDDCLEYLRAAQAARIAAAWSAWRASDADHDLRQWPRLCRRVLDALADAPAPADALQALRSVCGGRAVRDEPIAMAALQRYLASDPPWRPAEREQRELLRSRTGCAALAAERLLHLAELDAPFPLAAMTWQPQLALAVRAALQQEPELGERLATAARRERHGVLALSLLAIALPGHRPDGAMLRDLAHAPLAFLDLRGRTLGGDLTRVHLARANLDGAVLDDCVLCAATLRGATAAGASLRRVHADGLVAPVLRADGLVAEGARFVAALLPSASLRAARLAYADFTRANLLDADLTGADLDHATLAHCDLRRTALHRAWLRCADCTRVLAAGVDWLGLRAPSSDWTSADLTAARLPGAALPGASLRNCRLARVDLDGADLRAADLRGATFHLGNARSGLVGSEIACEGSRTGFYTDESFEDLLREPESVRAANLCGADLRGANLDGVDLYLVDLRGARLDAAQREHARRCRAILDRAQ
jgi:uncharacterized protein YjbI with pentapeptide repeats